LRRNVNRVTYSVELGTLLRQWRQRLTPEEVGLTVGPRRRVKGLRRQEVAQLAGVSTDYLAQLEQGRAAAPSAQVLLALARALRLSDFERDHLLSLAGYGPTTRLITPPPDVLRLVDQLDGTPAAIYDLAWNPVAWNPMWATVNGDPMGRPVRERNMLWRLMTDLPTRIRRGPAELQRIQGELVGDLRARVAHRRDDDRLTGFVADLGMRSAQFRQMWQSEHVAAYRHEDKAIDHPEVGMLHVDADVLAAGHDDVRLVIYTARRWSPTADRLAELNEGLRAHRSADAR
jgi:transcriptional regulator with XRE-family HTH domain